MKTNCVGCTDEEIGGKEGMKKFVLTQKFRDLNVGFAFDEGLAHPENIIQVIYGERSIWREYEPVIMNVMYARVREL
jgi:hypothetical protein